MAAMCKSKEAIEKKMDDAFKLIDTDGCKHITREELSKWLGTAINHPEIEKMMNEGDADGCGKISLDDFKKVISSMISN